jgi:DNA topoisomerase IB
VLAAVALAVSAEARSASARRRAVTRAMKEVSTYLGNTPAVCRKSYVDPRIVDRYYAGITIPVSLQPEVDTEAEVLSILDDDQKTQQIPAA